MWGYQWVLIVLGLSVGFWVYSTLLFALIKGFKKEFVFNCWALNNIFDCDFTQWNKVFIFDIRNTRVEIQYYLFPVIELIWMFGPIKLAFCYISVCTKPGKWGLCICVSGISILSLSIYILLDFGDVSTVWYFSPSY